MKVNVCPGTDCYLHDVVTIQRGLIHWVPVVYGKGVGNTGLLDGVASMLNELKLIAVESRYSHFVDSKQMCPSIKGNYTWFICEIAAVRVEGRAWNQTPYGWHVKIRKRTHHVSLTTGELRKTERVYSSCQNLRMKGWPLKKLTLDKTRDPIQLHDWKY